MKRAQLVEKRREEFSRLKYRRVFWSFYDYSFLDKILTIRKPGRGTNESYNEIICHRMDKKTEWVCICLS